MCNTDLKRDKEYPQHVSATRSLMCCYRMRKCVEREVEVKRHLLKLCLSPEAEWTITFRNPHSPVDSSSAKSSKQKVKK